MDPLSGVIRGQVDQWQLHIMVTGMTEGTIVLLEDHGGRIKMTGK